MIFLLSCFTIGILNVLLDEWLISLNRYIKHGIHTVVVAALCASLLWYLAYLGVYTILEAMTLIPLAIALRWIYHDLMLNIVRGKPFDYLSDNAKSDIFLSSFDNQFKPKTLALALSLFIYLIPYYL